MWKTEILIPGEGFMNAFQPWAGDCVDDFDWDAIYEDFNDALKALEPDGVSWGYYIGGPWCVADVNLDYEEVRSAFKEAVASIDFNAIAIPHDKTAKDIDSEEPTA